MLLELVEKIVEKGATLTSISEPWADTMSTAGETMMAVFAGLSEFERVFRRNATAAGRGPAMTRGVKFGRPSKISQKELKAANAFCAKEIRFVKLRLRMMFITQRSIDSCDKSQSDTKSGGTKKGR